MCSLPLHMHALYLDQFQLTIRREHFEFPKNEIVFDSLALPRYEDSQFNSHIHTRSMCVITLGRVG